MRGFWSSELYGFQNMHLTFNLDQNILEGVQKKNVDWWLAKNIDLVIIVGAFELITEVANQIRDSKPTL